MKILNIAPGYRSDQGYGVRRVISEVTPSLRRLGHEVHILTSHHEGGLEGGPEDAAPLHAPKEKYPFFAYNDTLQAVLENLPLSERLVELWESTGPFDLVVGHDWTAALTASFGKTVYGHPLVAFLHGTQVGRMEGKGTREEIYVAEMEKWVSERADHVIVPSESVRREVEKHCLIPRRKTSVVPDAIGAEAFRAEVDLDDFRGMFAPPEEKLVLFVGRLSKEKGPDVLLGAIPNILRECPKTRFAFVGDGPLMPLLAEELERRQLKDRVQLAGYLGSVVLGAMYQAADLLVIPSRYEALGIVALEGAMHGLPMVATQCEGLREVAVSLPKVRIRPAVPGDANSLTRAVIDALKIRESSGRDRRPHQERVPRAFWAEESASGLLKVFESVMSVPSA